MKMNTKKPMPPRFYKLSVYVAACPYLTNETDTRETLQEHAEEVLAYAEKLTPVSLMHFEECTLSKRKEVAK